MYLVRGFDLPPEGKGFSALLEGEGKGDDQPATIRETCSFNGKEFRILTQTCESGGNFGFRHGYCFTRGSGDL
jgi:hypothetical protein